jgi:hypothetical protein
MQIPLGGRCLVWLGQQNCPSRQHGVFLGRALRPMFSTAATLGQAMMFYMLAHRIAYDVRWLLRKFWQGSYFDNLRVGGASAAILKIIHQGKTS